ncbi:LPO_1073/Vpar_1526 family protein [Pseudoalteromonas maricaloris]|uniref:LPO_1073/Vpar_1526 family protein n=1 Tax=Pseudoalteromonas maricaloris TaxID=184924 RepID=UPI00029AC487|nr:LPO_1073/Vpar_1526 family protein [Pseudoalteromonas flavipulchra]
MTQKATVKDGSTSVQVAGDMSVGLTFENCERLFNLLLQENFPRLEAVAAQKAKENVDKLVSATYKKLDERLDQIEVSKLAEPDVQSTFNSAVQGAAKKGDKIDINLLSELLQSRLEKDNDDYVDNCIESAVDIIPKLTNELLCVLPVVHFVQSLSFSDESVINIIFTQLNQHYLSQCNAVTANKLKTIASSGAGNYINIMGGNTLEDSFKKRYPILDTPDVNSKFPNVVSFLAQYDKLELHKLSLTTAGQVIAVKMLEKVFGKMSIKDCVQ